MSHPYGVLPEFDDEGEIARLALRSKNLGFTGAICPDPSWVEYCNRAFAPPGDRLEFYRETQTPVCRRGSAWHSRDSLSRHHHDDRCTG